MIVTTIFNRKKPPAPFTPTVYTPTPGYNHNQANNFVVYQEVLRRDKIIKDLVKEFKHKPGDELVPKHQDDVDKWGKCTMISIVNDYIHMEKDHKWPKNDNPLILTVSAESGELFYATTNYFL